MKTTLFVFLLSIAYFCPAGTSAQDTLTESTTLILSDSLDHNEKIDGLLKKSFQFFKFRGNRNKKEKERVQQVISELNKDINLNRDSLKIALDTIVKRLKDLIYAETLRELKSVTHSCSCSEQKQDAALIKKDSFCLSPKLQIIGWHKSGEGSRFKNYNYKYLTAINLYGYELAADGTPKNPKDWNAFSKDGGVIKYAQNNCTDVYLTVYNKSPSEISKFLKNEAAQDRLIGKLKEYAASKEIMGINIFFENIHSQDSRVFLRFTQKILQGLKNNDSQFIINISIPAIYNAESLRKVSAYDFEALNSMVDNYLVLTDTMTNYKTNQSQSSTPLHGIEDHGYGTIESTIDFYGNSKIPLSKLIISVSYAGLKWPVSDFTGKVNRIGPGPSKIPYNKIVQAFLNNNDPNISIEQGFDAVQAAAYLNIKETNKTFEPSYTQIWYDNSKSLKMKYEWLLENGLGGVSIQGLGYDDGYSELWDALGATLIRIDSIKGTSANGNTKEDTKPHSNSSSINTLTITITVVLILVFVSAFLMYRKSN